MFECKCWLLATRLESSSQLSSLPEPILKHRATETGDPAQLHAYVAGQWGLIRSESVLGCLEQPRQNKNLFCLHDEPTKEGPLKYVLQESPFASVSTVSRGHPSLVSLKGHDLYSFHHNTNPQAELGKNAHQGRFSSLDRCRVYCRYNHWKQWHMRYQSAAQTSMHTQIICETIQSSTLFQYCYYFKKLIL